MSVTHMQKISDIIPDLKTASSPPRAHTSPPSLLFVAGLGVQLSVLFSEQMELQQHSSDVRSSEKLPLLPEGGAH